jgi:hypothetical protein
MGWEAPWAAFKELMAVDWAVLWASILESKAVSFLRATDTSLGRPAEIVAVMLDVVATRELMEL